MKNILIIAFLALVLPVFGQGPRRDRERLTFDDATKTLTRERTVVVYEVIDTARILSDIERERAIQAASRERQDTLVAQLRQARRFYRKQQAGPREAQSVPVEAPPVPTPAPTPNPKTTNTSKKKKGQ